VYGHIARDSDASISHLSRQPHAHGPVYFPAPSRVSSCNLYVKCVFCVDHTMVIDRGEFRSGA
jgi:hypothetical protein